MSVGGRRVSPWRWEGSLFWGWRPGMALWGKGPPQLCTTCLIAHLTFAELNQGCLVWADCTRPTGQAGGLPEVQAAQAGLLKGPSGEEEQELSSCFSLPSWVWAPEGTGDGVGVGRCLLGSGHGATGWREMWATELFACLQAGTAHSRDTCATVPACCSYVLPCSVRRWSEQARVPTLLAGAREDCFSPPQDRPASLRVDVDPPFWMLVILDLGKWKQAGPWGLRVISTESLSQNTGQS